MAQKHANAVRKSPLNSCHFSAWHLHLLIAQSAFDAFQEDLSKEEVKVALLSALLLPLKALQTQGKKGKTVPAVPLVVVDSMKWPKKYAAFVQDVQAQAPELLAVSQMLQVLQAGVSIVLPFAMLCSIARRGFIVC